MTAGQQEGGGFQYLRVVAFRVPCPLTLMPVLLEAMGEWHRETCEREGCELILKADDEGNPEGWHRWPQEAAR